MSAMILDVKDRPFAMQLGQLPARGSDVVYGSCGGEHTHEFNRPCISESDTLLRASLQAGVLTGEQDQSRTGSPGIRVSNKRYLGNQCPRPASRD